MKSKLLWKKSLLILLISTFIIGGLPINSIKVRADDAKPQQTIEVKIISAEPRSCHVVYTIKGIKYESDKAGSRINQIAWKHMDTEARRSVMNAYHWCIDRRKSDFGSEFSGEMADWFNVQCGWKQASDAFEEKLMNKYNSSLVKEYSNIDEHYRKNYEPDLGEDLQYSLDKYPDVKALYDEQMTILSWEKSAFAAIHKAVVLRQKAAILSTSGDMIQLITDRVLVPNITVSGTGGFTTSIATEIFGYAASITGCMDNVINNLVGERTTSTDASQIIAEMNTALQLNEKILKKCDEKLASLKSEIEVTYRDWEKYYEAQSVKNQEEWEQTYAPLLEPIQVEADSEITDKIKFYEDSLAKLDSNSEEYMVLYEEYSNYYNSEKNAAIEAMNNWNETYLNDSQELFKKRPLLPGVIPDQESYNFSEGYSPYDDFSMSNEKYTKISSNINEQIDLLRNYSVQVDQFLPEAKKRYSAAKEAYAPILSKLKVFDDLAEYSNITYNCIDSNYQFCLGCHRLKMEPERTINNYKERLSIFYKRFKTYKNDKNKVHDEYARYQSAYIEAWENYKEAEEEINTTLNDLPDYVIKQNILYDEGRPYLDTRYFDHPSELFTVDVASTGLTLDEIMKKYNAQANKINLYHNQIYVYQDVLQDLNVKMAAGATSFTEFGTGIMPYHELVEIYGKFEEPTTQIPSATESGGWILPARLLCADFNGRGFSHEGLMACYEKLCANEIDFSNKVPDKEYEYFLIKETIKHLSNNRGLNSYADPRARASVITSYAESSAFSMNAPKLLASSGSEPDPYDDLVAPMINKIETARKNGGYISDPGYVSNVLFTIDYRLSGKSVDNFKDNITVNSDFVNIDSAEAYNYGELLTGKFELGISFTPKIYYSFKEDANFAEDVEVSIAGIDKDKLKYGKDDKGTYITAEGVSFFVEQSEEDIATENHDFSIKDVTKATLTSNGKIVTKCKDCGQVSDTKIIYYPKTIKLSATTYTYDGKAKKPSVSVVGADGKTISSTNYTVTYPSGRQNVDKYTINITFMGNYRGTKTLYFTINPKGTSISSLTAGSKKFTVKWKKPATQTTGYQIQYSTSSKFTNAKNVTVLTNKTTNKTISKLSAKKKYYVRVRTYKTVKINGKSTKIYSSWSKVNYVTTKK